MSRKEPKRTLKLKIPLLPILVISLLGIQIFYPFKGWAILLSGFGGMWVLSYIWARSLKKGLRLEREMRFDWRQVGDRVREHVVLENNSWAPGLWVEIDDHSDMSDYEISWVANVDGWRYQNWHTQGICGQRGIYTLGPVTLKTSDPFGVYEIAVDYTDSVNMMVAPPVIALPEIEIASGERVGEGSSSIRALKQTVSTAGVREYVPGDSLRWLHWPTTARIGDPFVHTFDDEPTSDWWVVLDMDSQVQAGEGEKSTEEHGVILAASLVNRGIEMGKNVGLVSHGEELVWHPPETGNSHLWEILRSLAKVKPGGSPLPALLQRLRMSLGARTSLIIVTPNLSVAWINALELLKRSGIVPTVILLDPASFGGQGSVEVFRRHLNKLNLSHYTISADFLDSPEDEKDGRLDFLLRQTQRVGVVRDRWEQTWETVKRESRKWGLIILFFAMMTKILSDAVRGLESDLLTYMLGGGLLVGWLFARSPLPGWAAALLNAGAGFLITTLRVGRLGGPLVGALVRGVRLVAPTLYWLFREGDRPDYGPLQLNLAEVWSGISALGSRIWEWTLNLYQGHPIYDPVTITFLWGLAIWGVVVWSMWAIIRVRKPLAGLAPALGLVVYSLATIGKSSYDLIFLLGSTIALMIFTGHDIREGTWISTRLNYSPAIRFRIWVAGIALSLGLMFFSLLTPSISLKKMAEFARGATGRSAVGQEIANSLGLESQAEGEVDILEESRAGGLPNDHLIGSGSELADQHVLTVRVESYQSSLTEDEKRAILTPLYLRSLTYDRYLGYGWESRDAEILDYVAGDQILTIEDEIDHLLRQEVQIIQDVGGFIFTAGTPLSVDHDFRVSWRLKETVAAEYDIFGGTVDAEIYRADSILPFYSVEELRSAGQAYPGWIRNRYLTLPSTVPDRVITLARDLTATELTPYDRVVAIERYLRQIPYNLDVSTGPAGADIADHFLFVLEEGYCDYYATSMVVLARAAGIPARYVMGYIAEDYDPERGAYIVTADQSHAWVEVYFPDLGWVPFEPTGGRPAMERPPEPFPELVDDFDFDLTPLVPEPRWSFENVPWLVRVTFFSVLGAIIFYWIISDWWLRRLSLEKLIPAIYKRIYRYGRWAGLSPNPGDTALTYSAALNKLLAEVSQGSHWIDWIYQAPGMISAITQSFVDILFSPTRDQVLHRIEILKTYRQLRPRLWLLGLMVRAHRYSILRPFFWIEPPLFIDSLIQDDE